MPDVKVAQLGLHQGGTDSLEGFYKIFIGEVLAAFARASVTMNRHITRSISHGKAARFPVFGRATAAYLKPGKSLDDIRENIPGNEVSITIDGLLTSSQMITDIEEAMRADDVRGEYARQMGEALAIAADGSVLAEAAKLVVAGNENITGPQGTGKGEILNRTVAAGSLGITEATGRMIVDILLEAKAKMSKNYVPHGDRYAYVDPDFHAALVASMVAINKDYGAVATIVEGNVLRIAGFDIIECAHLTRGGTDETNVLQGDGHVFPAAYKDKKPIIICHRTAVGTLKLRDLGLENARRTEYQADMLVAKYAMGHKGLRPEAAFLGVIE